MVKPPFEAPRPGETAPPPPVCEASGGTATHTRPQSARLEEVTPLATGLGDVRDRVHDASQVISVLRPRLPGALKTGSSKVPLLLGQITSVRHARHGDRVAHPIGTHPSQSVIGAASVCTEFCADWPRTPSDDQRHRGQECGVPSHRVCCGGCRRAPGVPVGERLERSASTVPIRTERCVRSTGLCTRRCATVRVSACPVGAGKPRGARLDHDLPVHHVLNHPGTLCLR